jgi:hypothetical protein
MLPVLMLAPGFTHQVFPDWYIKRDLVSVSKET